LTVENQQKHLENTEVSDFIFLLEKELKEITDQAHVVEELTEKLDLELERYYVLFAPSVAYRPHTLTKMLFLRLG